jgi:hypothetical protein
MHFLFDEEIGDMEEVSAEQLASAVETAEQFERVFLDPRPIFQQLRETAKEAWRKSPAELMERLQHPGDASSLVQRILLNSLSVLPQGPGDTPTIRPTCFRLTCS